MTIPLIILALGSIMTGFIPFHEFVSTDGKPFATELDFIVAIPSVLIGLVGIGIAFMMYKKDSAIPDKVASTFRHLYKWAHNKFYMDELYLFVTKKIIFRYISQPIAWFDRHIVDGTMNAVAETVQVVSFRIRSFQSGQLQKYAFVFISGAVMLAILFIYLWK
jgi:NADH-quinone oxidoreductase subunit L